MKKIMWSVLAVLFIIILSLLILQKPTEEDEFEVEILVENLDTPWAIDFLPDGKMIFTERYGVVSIFDKETRTIIAQLPVEEVSESGLLGIAVDPEFEQNNFIYVYYSYEKDGDIFNRVSRFILRDELFDEVVLLDDIPGSNRHDGGRIKFGPDGTLYITTGDATIPSLAQDINSLAGKILRMNKDGSVPEDNPFGNYVYSYGHRNPQGIAWQVDGTLFSAEHGPSRHDEVNIVVVAGNYGWPKQCGEDGDHLEPVRCYTEFTLAPSGIAFYQGDLYVAGLRGAQLRRIVFKGKTILQEEELFSGLGRIREAVEHQDYLYISTSNKDGRGLPKMNDDKIIRIKRK